jgi:hypothetical protein
MRLEYLARIFLMSKDKGKLNSKIETRGYGASGLGGRAQPTPDRPKASPSKPPSKPKTK